jgi:DNA polymerase
MRGEIFELSERTRGLVTIHPSYLLRIEDEQDKQAQYRQFVADLRVGAKALAVRAH